MSVACDVSSRTKEKTTSKSSKVVISLLINMVAVIFRLNRRQTDGGDGGKHTESLPAVETNGCKYSHMTSQTSQYCHVFLFSSKDGGRKRLGSASSSRISHPRSIVPL